MQKAENIFGILHLSQLEYYLWIVNKDIPESGFKI
jgi:hypothetical protein